MAPHGQFTQRPIPARAGIGLRAPHFAELIERDEATAWLEAHSENFFGEGGPPLHYLRALRCDYPLSFHGVGLSLGSSDPLSETHLKHLKRIVDEFEPSLVSEHLSWSSVDGNYFNDLLPVPCTDEVLAHFVERVGQTQDFLGRRILIENPSNYLQFATSTMSEPQLLRELAERSGCGLLLDVNNVFVSAHNVGVDAQDYLDEFPLEHVSEIHLAGHATNTLEDGSTVLIDDHGSAVREDVWALYRGVIERAGPVPTLIEWDSSIPTLDELLAQAALADQILVAQHARVA